MTTDSLPHDMRILHVTRAPIGGIFRHIVDVANGQIERGYKVGIVADSLTGGERAETTLNEVAPRLALGVHRVAIPREPHPYDVFAWPKLSSLINRLQPQVLHGHGAKAGVFVRLYRKRPNLIRVYTPHGGSLHYPSNTLKGKLYSGLERALMNRTELFLFESEFARDTYQRMVGKPKSLVRCVFNGVTAREFEPVVPADDATDIAYVGEFRHIKGADILMDAVARLRAQGRPVTLSLGGDGEETASLRAQHERLKLGDAVRFLGHVNPQYGFSKGRLLVVPSRGDSMPYVVIEAAAAGVPMLASAIGGIPEIFGPFKDGLVPASDPDALAEAIAHAIDNPETAQKRAQLMKQRVFQNFSQDAMVEGVLNGYGDAFANN